MHLVYVKTIYIKILYANILGGACDVIVSISHR